MKKIKIILDTDIGDDIDDAFALALALKSPEIEILGVTTVFRSCLYRAKMAKEVLKSYNKSDIPVYAGIDDPIKQDVSLLIWDEIRKKERFDEKGKYIIPQYMDSMDDNKVDGEDAVQFIIDAIKKYPHEVVLCPIGPLTNIAAAFTKAPEIIPLIKEVRIMGGGLDIDFSEWNILCDPEAAKIVYETDVPLVAVGINVTSKTPLSEEDIKYLKDNGNSSNKLIYDMMMKRFAHYNFRSPVMHDPLAISSFFLDCVTFKDLMMKVDVDGKRGRTYVDEKEGRLIKVAVDVDAKMFLNEFKKRIF